MIQSVPGDIQVNIPFSMLRTGYLHRFIRRRLNPEIGMDAESLDTCPPPDFREIAGKLRGAGLIVTLHAPFNDLSPGSIDARIRAVTRKRFEQVLRLIPVFRPRAVVCHAAYEARRYGYVRDAWIENSLEMWSWFGSRVRDMGSLLTLENVFEQGPDDIRVLFENLPGVGFCLDTGHVAAFSNTPMETWIASLGSRLAQLHLHDNKGSADEHLGLGKGTIDFKELLSRVKTVKERPPIITLEPHREADLKPSLEYLARVWPW
ncbi:MAG: sugar phosphate isomerase/epimerase [Deltaproteobacteria bacterium]|nr:MAG: sugar phosphate isomerase/epimerase [Deltaproteobacteria bacterium]